VINWPVLGCQTLTVLASVDGQFITVSIQFSLQYDAREAARRAGSYATVDGLFVVV